MIIQRYSSYRSFRLSLQKISYFLCQLKKSSYLFLFFSFLFILPLVYLLNFHSEKILKFLLFYHFTWKIQISQFGLELGNNWVEFRMSNSWLKTKSSKHFIDLKRLGEMIYGLSCFLSSSSVWSIVTIIECSNSPFRSLKKRKILNWMWRRIHFNWVFFTNKKTRTLSYVR